MIQQKHLKQNPGTNASQSSTKSRARHTLVSLPTGKTNITTPSRRIGSSVSSAPSLAVGISDSREREVHVCLGALITQRFGGCRDRIVSANSRTRGHSHSPQTRLP
eukprot:2599741-Rhodomonas_salina.1